MTQLPLRSSPVSLPLVEGSDAQNSALETLLFLEYLEQDDRASFVIDLHGRPEGDPIYWNPILRRNKGLQDRIRGLQTLYDLKDTLRHSADWDFLKWQRSPSAAGHAASCRYGQNFWIATTLRDRWRVISIVKTVQNLSVEAHDASLARSETSSHANTPHPRQEPQKAANAANASQFQNLEDKSPNGIGPTNSSDNGSKPASTPLPHDQHAGDGAGESPQDMPSYFNSRLLEYESIEDRFLTRPQARVQSCDLGPFDWTRPDPSVAITPFIKFFRNLDWASTVLGPMETWSPDLRRYVVMLMADSRPAAMFIGPQRIILYNQGYTFVLGRYVAPRRSSNVPSLADIVEWYC